jgi:acyl dehydratase
MSRYEKLMALEFPTIVHRYTRRDTILYALGVGAGDPSDDPWELRHVYERNLSPLPTMAVVLASPGNWYKSLPTGLDDSLIVHASERLEIHNSIPPEGAVVARPEIVAVHDKGQGRGALVVSRRAIADQATGAPIATVLQTAFCRGDGGMGGPITQSLKAHEVSAREPDVTIEMRTSGRSALIYRLSGDDNPLHADPGFAQVAGFPRPILHGLATYGHVGRAALKAFCRDGKRFIRVMDCRFTAPVFPGDVLSVRLWLDRDVVSFRATVGSRVVVDNGFILLASEDS